MNQNKERISSTEDYEVYRSTAERIEAAAFASKASDTEYYWLVSKWARVATGQWATGDDKAAILSSSKCVASALQYFYGQWREELVAEKGLKGHEVWRRYCLWYEEVQCSLPFAAALSDWAAVKKIASYPQGDKQIPHASKAKGETAWGWALITYLREEPRQKVEEFLVRAESEKAKRPKLLAPVLRALMDKDGKEFSETLLAYLAYYRKSEFKTDLDKAIALDGTTLFHLGRRLGFHVELPEKLANHVVRFD